MFYVSNVVNSPSLSLFLSFTPFPFSYSCKSKKMPLILCHIGFFNHTRHVPFSLTHTHTHAHISIFNFFFFPPTFTAHYFHVFFQFFFHSPSHFPTLDIITDTVCVRRVYDTQKRSRKKLRSTSCKYLSFYLAPINKMQNERVRKKRKKKIERKKKSREWKDKNCRYRYETFLLKVHI